ncbi:MAG: class F sortase [Nonomuraea sp.]|nr:class F sortase [Nonomuraea sp.]
MILVVFGKSFVAPKPSSASVYPENIDIPSIDVDAPLMKLKLEKSGDLQLPPFDKPKVAGWYSGSAVPGDKGASVIVGHVDTKSAPAVFFKLRQVRKGAIIKVDRSDGKTVSYKVDSVEQIPKDHFPARRVYVDAGLKLVTCGGQFDYSKGEYVDNIIVYASPA